MMKQKVPMCTFKKLTPQEEADYRLWARRNYEVGEDIEAVWHPIVQHECACILLEAYNGKI